MNKTALKKFATEARLELLDKIELQARKLGITSESIQKANVESSDAIFIDGRQLSNLERRQRNSLISRIDEIGFDQVIEETAYTWFNRFIALRFMEVNDYLPTKVRVLSSSTGSTEPDMIREALSLDLDLDKELVYEMKLNNRTDELFKNLIKAHCNDLNKYMPFMFETIEDYTELLFPEGLLGTNSFVRIMTDTNIFPENDWRKVEIVGWLYQYYVSDEKEQVFANLKKNIKVTKEKIPAATQIFTPNWIVRYLVENSLGKLWLESYPKSSLVSSWKYYVDEAKQTEDVLEQLENIRYKNVKPEDITFIDPSCGSGHILVYAFDVFYDLYLEKGYLANDIPKMIIEKNLFGLEIDDRAAQLAAFSLMMKAREKSRHIFRKLITPNVCSIQESNWFSEEMIEIISAGDDQVFNMLYTLRNNFIDAKEYGSLINIKQTDMELLEKSAQKYVDGKTDIFELENKQKVQSLLPKLLKQATILSRKYDVVCTNPPYMGRSSMNNLLTKFLEVNYKENRQDLFSAFIEKGFKLTKNNGFNSMVTMQSWMFLSTYEIMRKNILEKRTISSLLHMDNMVMGIAFGTSASVFRKANIEKYKGIFNEVKYVDLNEDNIPITFPIDRNNNTVADSIQFKKISGSPIAYWASERVQDVFEKGVPIGDIAEPKQGLSTANNNRFLRLWHEVNFSKIGLGIDGKNIDEILKFKWFPLNKGGKFRKWYGNNDFIIDWENNGEALKNFKGAAIRNSDYYFKEGITWTLISSSSFGSRYSEKGFIFDNAGSSLFSQSNIFYILGLLTSKISEKLFEVINPTLNYSNGVVSKLPFIYDRSKNPNIEKLVKECIEISKEDWNNFENSWNFKKHPFLNYSGTSLENSFRKWEKHTEFQFATLKRNEVILNQLFLKIYNLDSEITSDVEEKNVTIHKANLERDVKSFISYAVGVSFGRYSLDEEGLVFAGGEFESSRYQSFQVDKDNILPVLSGAYFEDDIVTRFIDFMRITFSEETLEENLDFVANAVGRRKNETARETLRRYFLKDFFKDHVQVYNKRPIYWMFTSGKEKAFNCLVYMHRYDKTTLSRIRTDYLHEVQIRLDAEKVDLLDIINGDSTPREVTSAKKELKVLERKIDELKAYDEKLHHMADMQIEIDLDDGVKINYEKFKGLVAKI